MTPLPDPAMTKQVNAFTKEVMSVEYYTADQMRDYGKAEYERALLAAMNATRIYGKTGMVIAASMRFLKETP